MTFKKRFLMCLAIVGVLLVPSMAKAGDAVALNKWMLGIPDSAEMINATGAVTARFARVRGDGQSIKRNQKFYMAFFRDDSPDGVSGIHVNQNGTSTLCSFSGGTCASAPLFIASDTAIVCMDGDVTSATATGSTGSSIRVKICADSTCTDAKSITHQGVITETPYLACGVGGSIIEGKSGGSQQNVIGGQWIYVELSSGTAAQAEHKTLVWITGQ